MKYIVVFLTIVISNCYLGQDTLREVNSVMYSRYYILYEDGQFELNFNHCTGTTKSFGTYKMNNRKITFKYSSLPDSVNNDTTENNMITFQEDGIKKMKRINNSDFLFSKTIIEENEKKPWKKGKTRKLKYIYRIE